MMNELIREATIEEMAIYEKVNDIVLEMEDDEAEEFIEIVGDSTFSANDKIAHNRLEELAKNYNLTAEECITWYCIDED